jgi:hypothetical protein
MGTNDYILFVVIGFFGLVLHSIHKDEKRRLEQRQQRLSHPMERRKWDRRGTSIHSYLAWVIRSQWSKLTK